MEEIRLEDEAEKAAGFISVVKLFKLRSLRWQLISIILLMGGQQLSGVNAVRGLPGAGAAGSIQAAARPAPPASGCFPDLLLRRPDLPECWRGSQRCPVRDGGHRGCQRGDNHVSGECPGELGPISCQGWRASREWGSWPRKEPRSEAATCPSVPPRVASGLCSDDSRSLVGGNPWLLKMEMSLPWSQSSHWVRWRSDLLEATACARATT